MKIRQIKRLVCIALSLCLAASLFSGCSKSAGAIDFIYPFSANVRSYDPQVASTTDEFLIIENTFEGLVRVNDDGTVKPGVAESWDVSSDGLTYTFKLKKGMKWNIDTELDTEGKRKEDKRLDYMGYDFNPDITANDFVFALRRAAAPETECPLFSSIACIENAPQVHSGKIKAAKLGVKATDDYTLEIKLSSADDSFMSTLSTAVAMPCNQEFFNATKGRYGLSEEYTLFNGQFYLSQILESSYLLKKNKFYTGDSPANASELTLKITDETNSEIVEKLKNGYYDAAFIGGSDTDSIKESNGITLTPYNDTAWAFVFNSTTLLFQNKDLRNGFCLGLTRLSESDKGYLTDAGNLIPTACTVGNSSAAELMGSTVAKQDIDKSVELWSKGLGEIGETTFTVTVVTPKSMEKYVKQMLQGVQSGIGNVVKNPNGDKISLTIKVNALDDGEYKDALTSKNYDIAFCSYKSSSSSPTAYLSGFSGISGVDSDKLAQEIEKANSSTTSKENAQHLKNAENAIIGDYCVYPMLYETSYYASAKGVSGIQFHAGTGRISFVYANREK